MKKLILTFVLFSTSAIAGWTHVGGDERMSYYADFATIDKSGDTSTMWSLLDFKAVQSVGDIKPFYSINVKTEYSCGTKQSRTLEVVYTSGSMGRGETVYSIDSEVKFTSVPSGSIEEVNWKIACEE